MRPPSAVSKHGVAFEEAVTVFDDPRIRVISARDATRAERDAYEEEAL